MPVFKNRMVFEVTRGVKAFLSLEAGVTRGELPWAGGGARVWKLGHLGGGIKRIRRRIPGTKPGKATPRRVSNRAPEVDPGKIIWVFGSGRTGSTWLARMMEEIEGHTVWFEPRVGDVFDPSRLRFERRKGGKHFILGERYKDSWLRLIRDFVLDGAKARFPKLTRDSYLVIKEPSGSVAAPLLAEAIPESRLILLLRDPRDTLASWVAAHKKGNWLYEWTGRGRRRDAWGTTERGQEGMNEFVRKTAGRFARNVMGARQAYEAHEGHKVLVRYEDLRADTLGVMKELYSSLKVPVDEKELVRVVEKHSWENIPRELKGEGKFYRKATPGGWREDLTPEQIKVVEKITAPILGDFYSDR